MLVKYKIKQSKNKDYTIMTTEALGTQEAPIPKQWQRAIANAPSVLRGLDPKLTDEQLAAQVSAVESKLTYMAESETLKLVTYLTDDGNEIRSVEPDWAETTGYGLPVDVFVGLMGLDDTHIFQHGDATSSDLLGALADATQKPVSAMVAGQFVSAVAPQIAA